MRRTALSLALGLLPACSAGAEPSSVTKLQPATDLPGAGTPGTAAAPPGQIATGAVRSDCKLADPDASCCERDFGLDPAALASACGLGEYLGELRAATACQHRFAGNPEGADSPAVVAFSVAEFRGRSNEQAIEHHMRGFFGAQTGDQIGQPGLVDGVHYSGDGNRGWAFVPGWSAPRRVAWGQAACPQTAMIPVLQTMAKAAEPPRPAEAAIVMPSAPRPLPPGTHEGVTRSILGEHATTHTELPVPSALPNHAKRLIVLLFERAARDTLNDMKTILHPDARYGMPDRREVRARPVFEGDGGRRFLDALRTVASRFASDTKFACPPLSPEGSQKARDGQWPMYCYYQSTDSLDMMIFKLVVRDGRAAIDYVGFFAERPTAPTRADGEPPPPPARPLEVRRAEATAARARGELPPGRQRPQPPGPLAPAPTNAVPPTGTPTPAGPPAGSAG